MNLIILTGNLTHDPETRQTPSGDTVCSFTIAVNRKFPDKNGDKITDYFRVNAWRKLGETCQKWLTKGKKVAVRGELQPRLYDAKDGSTKMSLDLSADDIEFLSPRGEVDTPREEPKPQTENPLGVAQPGSDDDMPF